MSTSLRICAKVLAGSGRVVPKRKLNLLKTSGLARYPICSPLSREAGSLSRPGPPDTGHEILFPPAVTSRLSLHPRDGFFRETTAREAFPSLRPASLPAHHPAATHSSARAGSSTSSQYDLDCSAPFLAPQLIQRRLEARRQ